ncbi:hypothetical protein TNCV_404531 [Trichonephila clavipes]|nr:hypothetical protein TNCV_404531 [Trichonephila clavipes]
MFLIIADRPLFPIVLKPPLLQIYYDTNFFFYISTKTSPSKETAQTSRRKKPIQDRRRARKKKILSTISFLSHPFSKSPLQTANQDFLRGNGDLRLPETADWGLMSQMLV